MKIRMLKDIDFSNGFIECLEELGKVNTSITDMMIIFKKRKKYGIKTFVILDEKDSKVIASASIILEPKFRYTKNCCHLEDVCVVKTHQNKGIGKILVNHIIKYVKNKKCYKIILNCSENNLNFYKKFGFFQHENSLRLDITD